MRVRRAEVSAKATMVSVAEPVRCATIAGLRKIPDPMIPPTTRSVPEKRPSRRACALCGSRCARLLAAAEPAPR